ncbi:MAG: hypothetical protein VYE22_22375 [Myxococcota bacterium]|nr:hypothetical protein [Myxococcota bacterium]
MRELDRIAWHFGYASAGDWAWVAVAAAALMAAGFACATRAGRRRAAAVAATLTAGSVIPLLWSLGRDRQRSLQVLVDRSSVVWLLEEPQQLLLLPLLTLALPAALIGLGRAWPRHRGLALTAAALAAVVGVANAGWVELLTSAYWGEIAPLEVVARIQEQRVLWSWGVCVVGLVSGAVLMASRIRRGERLGPPALVLAGLVFAVGATAFAWTRDHARDVSAARSLQSDRGGLESGSSLPSTLRARCAPITEPGSTLFTFGDEVLLDGRSLDFRRHAILHEIIPFPAGLKRVYVWAPSAEARALWRRKMEEAGWTETLDAYRRTDRVRTATLGEVTVRTVCAVR